MFPSTSHRTTPTHRTIRRVLHQHDAGEMKLTQTAVDRINTLLEAFTSLLCETAVQMNGGVTSSLTEFDVCAAIDQLGWTELLQHQQYHGSTLPPTQRMATAISEAFAALQGTNAQTATETSTSTETSDSSSAVASIPPHSAPLSRIPPKRRRSTKPTSTSTSTTTSPSASTSDTSAVSTSPQAATSSSPSVSASMFFLHPMLWSHDEFMRG